MKITTNSKVGARFKIVVRRASDDSVARETDWFNNLVLNRGLAQMSKGVWINRVCVGTGNSTPTHEQQQLDLFLASTTTTQSSSSGVQTGQKPHYRWAKIVWRFAQGVAVGNISEVGLGWGNNTLWNRALIRDRDNNPTTITILSDEYLDVVSEVREYPATKYNGSFVLKNKYGQEVSTHTVVGMPILIDASPSFNKIIANSGNNYGSFNVYSGTIGTSVATLPSGNLTSDQISGISEAYPTETSIIVKGELGLDKANGVHQSFDLALPGLLTYNYTMKRYKFQISPPITKNNTQIMSYTFSMSWGRYEPS